jgi:hypothetical protein
MADGHFDSFAELTEDTVAFCEGTFALIVLFDVPLKGTDSERYLSFMRSAVAIMNPLKRYTIKTGGVTVGIGYTRKYKAGSPIEAYLVREQFRSGDKITLEDVAPELNAVGVEIVELLSHWLGQCFPQGLVERFRVATRFRLPQIGASLTTVAFVTFDFLSAVHRDKDNGNACAVARAFEEHEPHCRRKGSCRSNWIFYIADLGVYVRLRHGLFFVFDSETFSHGTSCDSEPVPGGCHSRVYVCVSQVKRRHMW